MNTYYVLSTALNIFDMLYNSHTKLVKMILISQVRKVKLTEFIYVMCVRSHMQQVTDLDLTQRSMLLITALSGITESVV